MVCGPGGPMRWIVVTAALSAGCAGGTLSPEPGPPPVDPPPLALDVTAPVYGSFSGDAAVRVEGSVNDPSAWVFVEGRRANVGPDGRFSVELEPIAGDFRVIDVEAARPGTHLRERRPVFSGEDPLASWPGAVSLRLTPLALEHVAELLQVEVEALDLPGMLGGLIPAIDLGGFAFTPTGATARPPTVALTSSPAGLDLSVGFQRMEWAFTLDSSLTGTVPVVLGLDSVELGVAATLGLDGAGGLAIGVGDTTVALGDPVLEFGGLDPNALESLAGGLTSGIAVALEGALDLGTLLLGNLSLPALAFDTELLGMPLSLALSGVGTDADGVGATLAVDLGVPAPGTPAVPSLDEAGPRADLAVALHEGLLQGLLDSDLLSLLDLDLELPGLLAEIVALPLAGLPGGEQLPADRTAICLALGPGDARLARLGDSVTDLGTLLLPDVGLSIGVSSPGLTCVPWLDASLALEVGLQMDGTAVTPRIEIVDGAVLSYAATGEFDEDLIVGGLGALIDASLSLLGGSLTFDLSELLAGGTGGLAVGDLAPRLLDLAPVEGPDGPLPGLRVLSLSLWD